MRLVFRGSLGIRVKMTVFHHFTIKSVLCDSIHSPLLLPRAYSPVSMSYAFYYFQNEFQSIKRGVKFCGSLTFLKVS